MRRGREEKYGKKKNGFFCAGAAKDAGNTRGSCQAFQQSLRGKSRLFPAFFFPYATKIKNVGAGWRNFESKTEDFLSVQGDCRRQSLSGIVKAINAVQSKKHKKNVGAGWKNFELKACMFLFVQGEVRR